MIEASNPPFAVSLVEGLNGTPAAELAVRGWLELVEKGWSDGALNMSTDLHAHIGYAANGRDMLPVGVITFSIEPARVWVHQSYVLPDFRGRGVYTAMWSKLVEHVNVLLPTVKTIESTTHVNNKNMRTIAARLGRRETVVGLRFDIPR